MSESRSGNNFKCPKCGATKGSAVLDSRAPQEGSYIRRRRSCNACGYRFSTRETFWNDDPELPQMKREDVLALRAVALDIIRRTDAIVPVSNPPVPT